MIAQGHPCEPVTIHQDNMSCIALIDQGRSAAERTRHISIKYFWLKERVDMGEARGSTLVLRTCMPTCLPSRSKEHSSKKGERESQDGRIKT